MLRKVIFAAQSSAQDRALQNTGERVVNMYPEPVSEEARSPLLLWNVPGLSIFSGSSSLPLDMLNTENGLYIVDVLSGNFSIKLIESDGGVDTEKTSAISSDENLILSENNGYLAWAMAGVYYAHEMGSSGVISSVGSGAFSSVGTVTYLDGYTILSEKDGRRVEWTDLADPTSRDALNVKVKEGRSDNVVRVMASQGRLYVMGERSFEVWYNTGQPTAAAFERVPGAVFDVGLRGVKLACEYEDRIWFLTDDGAFASIDGMNVSPIRSPLIAEALATGTPTNVFAYEDRGHKFVCIRFSNRPAVCYDLTTGLFHERSTGSALGAWDVVATAKAYGSWRAARRDTSSAGGLATIGRTHVDEPFSILPEYPLTRTIRSRPLEIEGRMFRVPSLTLRFQPTSAAFDVTMKHSRDGGKTWTTGRTKSVATTSETGRLRFNSLGRARLFQVEVTMDDEAETVMEAAAIVDIA